MTTTARTRSTPTGCTTCGRVRSTAQAYALRGPEVIVQGVRLATCTVCLGEQVSPDPNRCDGRCRGVYTTEVGTYHELRWRPVNTRRRSHLAWACWDITCVEAWEESSWVSDDDTIEYGIHTVVDGTYID